MGPGSFLAALAVGLDFLLLADAKRGFGRKKKVPEVVVVPPTFIDNANAFALTQAANVRSFVRTHPAAMVACVLAIGLHFYPVKKPDAETTSDSTAAPASPPANATAAELKLLDSIDAAMKNATPSIPVPQIKTSDLGPPPTKAQLFSQLAAPFAVLVASVGSALLVIFLANPTVKAAFPYYTCVLAFVGAIPASKAQVTRAVGSVIDQITSIENKVSDTIDEIGAAMSGALNSGKSNVVLVLSVYKPKLAMASKFEGELKKLDPDLKMPDLGSLETALDQPLEQCATAISSLKGLVDIKSMVPPLVQSEANFLQTVFYPILAAQLALQLYACFQANGFDPSKFPNTMTSEEKYAPIFLALEASKESVIAILVAAVLCQASVAAMAINGMITKIAAKVQGLVDQEIGTVCNEVFGVLMGALKTQITTLMDDMLKLEKPLKKVSSFGFM